MCFKHAYCIIAHHQWVLLKKLIGLLDDDENDLYLHIDAKSIEDFHRFGGIKTNHSSLIIIDNPIDVEWSDVSLCDAEVSLFKKVLESNVGYQYVHLISGEDLPLMNQNKIHDYFKNREEPYTIKRYAKAAFVFPLLFQIERLKPAR